MSPILSYVPAGGAMPPNGCACIQLGVDPVEGCGSGVSYVSLLICNVLLSQTCASDYSEYPLKWAISSRSIPSCRLSAPLCLVSLLPATAFSALTGVGSSSAVLKWPPTECCTLRRKPFCTSRRAFHCSKALYAELIRRIGPQVT